MKVKARRFYLILAILFVFNLLIEAFAPDHHSANLQSNSVISFTTEGASDSPDFEGHGCHIGHCSHVILSEFHLRFTTDAEEPETAPANLIEDLAKEPLLRPPIS